MHTTSQATATALLDVTPDVPLTLALSVDESRVASVSTGRVSHHPAASANDDFVLLPQANDVPLGGGSEERREDGRVALPDITNAEFIDAVMFGIPEGAAAAVCTKRGDPITGGWTALRADLAGRELPGGSNNYIGCSSFRPDDDGSIKARKDRFAACHFLMLDDVGTKVPLERLGGLPFSWLIETSTGNHQAGIILAEPITDAETATRLLKAIIDGGFCDPGASGPLGRWARLPQAINGKPKYADEAGKPFRCRLVEWHPDRHYTPQEIARRLQLKPAATLPPKKQIKSPAALVASAGALDVLTAKADENPVIGALKTRGLYKTPLGSGRHDVTCPWVHEHTDALDSGSAYFEPSGLNTVGGFCCQHSHRDEYHIRELIDYLGVPKREARNQDVTQVQNGELHQVVDAAEKLLAAEGRHFQAGGLIVRVATDPTSGDPAIVPINANALTRELSAMAAWEKFDARSSAWVPSDPPTRHVQILYDGQSFNHLAPLVGVARQPHYRESDGVLVTEPGYDSGSQRFGVFDPRTFAVPDPTPEAARAALTMLEDLLTEFRFVGPEDRAAALSAIFTAVVRSTLAYAPAFHARAPVFGSGKTYLCELIGAFAGPAGNTKVSYPTTAEEATKMILSLLLTGPAVIEFDDMDTDWTPHGTIKRMLTTDRIADRILGYSKVASVSTRTLFLGSGNNVGPVRDLLRRVLTINIDPRCATPATLTYNGAPVDRVRKNRGAYVAAVLTIIEAWRKADSPRAAVENIATFGGAWSDYCRHPLLWLGHADPATSLFDQIRHDPDADALLGLMKAWKAAFGSSPTTVRKAVDAAAYDEPDLLDAIREFPVEERGGINRSKLGWLLKKNANRVVGGLELQRAEADGRVAWRVAEVSTPESPAFPPSHRLAAEAADTSSEVLADFDFTL